MKMERMQENGSSRREIKYATSILKVECDRFYEGVEVQVENHYITTLWE